MYRHKQRSSRDSPKPYLFRDFPRFAALDSSVTERRFGFWPFPVPGYDKCCDGWGEMDWTFVRDADVVAKVTPARAICRAAEAFTPSGRGSALATIADVCGLPHDAGQAAFRPKRASVWTRFRGFRSGISRRRNASYGYRIVHFWLPSGAPDRGIREAQR